MLGDLGARSRVPDVRISRRGRAERLREACPELEREAPGGTGAGGVVIDERREWRHLARRQRYHNGRVCVVCGQTFMWSRVTARFCSNYCRGWFTRERARVRRDCAG